MTAIGIGGDLQQGDRGGQQKQRHQEHPVGFKPRCRHEDQGAARHADEAQHHRGLVSGALEQLGGRDRHQQISEVERELNQQRLTVVEAEDGF
jgi:hypothetical protein